MNSDSGAIYNCRPSSPPEYASRFFVRGRKAQGYLWSNHYTISSPRRPCCIHLSVGSPLSRSASPCHFPSLSLSLPLSLLFHLSFIQSLSSRFLCVFCPSPWRSVGCNCCMLAGGERKIQYYQERKERGGLILSKQPQQNKDQFNFYHKLIERERERNDAN